MGGASAIIRAMTAPFLLNHFSTPEQVVGYRLGSYVETKFYPTVLAPLGAAHPALTAMHATGQDERLQRYYFRMSRYVLWVYLFFAIPAIVYRQELWELYLGAEKAALYSAAPAVMGFLFAKAFFVFAQPILAQIALARGRVKALALRVFSMELVTIAFICYILVRHDAGASGAALVCFVVPALGSPLLVWSLGVQMTNSRLRDFLRESVGRGLVPAVFATPVWIGAWLLAPPDSWLVLGLAFASGWVVYATVLLRFCLVPGERADLRKIVDRALGILPGRQPA